MRLSWKTLLGALLVSTTLAQTYGEDIAGTSIELGMETPSMRPATYDLGSNSGFWRSIRNERFSVPFDGFFTRSASPFYVSFMIDVSQGNCTNVRILKSFGENPSELQAGLNKYFEGAGKCTPSFDGSDMDKTSIHIVYWSQGDDKSVAYGFQGRGSPRKREELEAFADAALSLDKAFSPESISQFLEHCEEACYAYAFFSAMFAMATGLDASGMQVSGAQWRSQALDIALQLPRILKKHSDELLKHTDLLLDYSLATNDFAMAKRMRHVIDEIEGDPEFSETLRSRIDSLEEEAIDEFAHAIELPSATTNPFSEHHSSIIRYITGHEFRFYSTAGDIEFAWLDCERDSAELNPVQLNLEQRKGWTIPPNWEDCRLTILGPANFKAKIWEYPPGTLDIHGNPNT